MSEQTLVLYVFHEFNNRVQHFIDNAIFKDDNIQFIFISNDINFNLKAIVPDYVKTLNRDNIGYDFGGWSDALLTNNLYQNYDKFIFCNSSIIGPFLPENFTGKWTDIYLNGLKNNVKLFGSTINTIGDPVHKSHVQSYIFSMNKATLELLINRNIFSQKQYATNMTDAIYNKEVRMSRVIIRNGGNIGSLFKKYKDVDFSFKKKKVSAYNFQFNHCVMSKECCETLWKKTDLVFIKGNRGIPI
jgi:lipopolysaccharide biosynthesis protein